MNIAVAAFVSTLLAWASAFISTPRSARPSSYAVPLRHAVASVDGLRPFHRAGSPADQLRQRHARQLCTDRHYESRQYAADRRRHGVRHRLGRPCLRHRQFREGPEHDAPSHLSRVRRRRGHIGRRILHDFQHSAPPALGRSRRRHHRRLYPELRQSRAQQSQHRSGLGAGNRVSGRVRPDQHNRVRGPFTGFIPPITVSRFRASFR